MRRRLQRSTGSPAATSDCVHGDAGDSGEGRRHRGADATLQLRATLGGDGCGFAPLPPHPADGPSPVCGCLCLACPPSVGRSGRGPRGACVGGGQTFEEQMWSDIADHGPRFARLGGCSPHDQMAPPRPVVNSGMGHLEARCGRRLFPPWVRLMFFCVKFEDMRTGVMIFAEVSIEKICQAKVIFHGLDCMATPWLSSVRLQFHVDRMERGRGLCCTYLQLNILLFTKFYCTTPRQCSPYSASVYTFRLSK